MESRVSVLESELTEKSSKNMEIVEETILALQRELNERDQELILNDVLLTGIPEEKAESLPHIIKLVATKLAVDMQDSDIVNIERIGPARRNLVEPVGVSDFSADQTAQRPRVIAVRLARRSTRDALLRASRVRRVLTTTDIEMPGRQRRIYLNERLTRNNYQLFHRTREVGRKSLWRYIWTRDGKIFVKREDGTLTFRVYNDNDLKKIFGK